MSEAEERDLETARLRQQAIDATLRERGGYPIDAIREQLVRELAQRGLDRPPEQWLESVAVEIRANRVYVASADAGRGDPVVERRDTGGQLA